MISKSGRSGITGRSIPAPRPMNRAVAVLKKYVPEIVAGTDRADAEAMSKCLNDSRYRAQLFRMPTEAFDKAIREIETIRA